MLPGIFWDANSEAKTIARLAKQAPTIVDYFLLAGSLDFDEPSRVATRVF
jgi:hypothetical protein